MSGNDTICYSGSVGKNSQHRLGTPHYSYRFAEEKFLACLTEMGIRTAFIEMPEYYSSVEAYSDVPKYKNLYLHIIFRSTEQIRILKQGYNIVCFAWEFPYIKDSTANGEHPFLNQKRMLSLCDEIWVPCEYTKGVLNAHGLDKVYAIPSAIAAADQPKLPRFEILQRLGHINTRPFMVNFLGNAAIRRRDQSAPLYAAFTNAPLTRKVYLSIFNPEDFRKNLDALIRGFDMFQQSSGGDDLLIIKALTSTDRFSLDEVVGNVMLVKLAPGSGIENENIIVFNDLLSAENMTMLYDLADYYVCTSIAEGQNLPLQEAMSRGIVPISTCNTAMLDYIDAENSIIIATSERLNTSQHLAGNVAGRPYNVEICDPGQVCEALTTASQLADADYSRMSKSAKDAIVSKYSIAEVSKAIQLRLETINL